ncbi:MAG: hypothetical protein ACI85S_000901 [Pseudohongiellaceae bacterium]|jgi:hypothetical protein
MPEFCTHSDKPTEYKPSPMKVFLFCYDYDGPEQA